MQNDVNKEFMTIPEFAELLGISRIAVFNKVKKGIIKAKKFGRIYLIPIIQVNNFLGKDLSPKGKNEIELAVKKTVRDYGEVLKMLGSE